MVGRGLLAWLYDAPLGPDRRGAGRRGWGVPSLGPLLPVPWEQGRRASLRIAVRYAVVALLGPRWTANPPRVGTPSLGRGGARPLVRVGVPRAVAQSPAGAATSSGWAWGGW